MSDAAVGKAEAQTPQAQLIHMATAYWASTLLYFAAEVELADRLAKAPKTADELAVATGSDAPSLYHVMRTLHLPRESPFGERGAPVGLAGPSR